MTLIAAMIGFYLLMCFTDMKRVAFMYLGFAVLNFILYPAFAQDFANGDISYALMYAIGEEFAKIYLIVTFCKRLHIELVAILFLHIINHGFIYTGYETINTVLIISEMIYFVVGAKRDLVKFYKGLYGRIIFWHGNHRRVY